MIVTLFWISVAALVYVYALFPVLVVLRGALFPKPYKTGRFTPQISVIVAAHNEERSIGTRIANLLEQGYPRELCEIIIASDGSTDRTCEIVRQHASDGVQLIELPRGGKSAALNAAAAAARGDVLVFTDANSHFLPGAIRALLKPLVDPTVGGVAGNQVYARRSTSLSAAGEQTYWNLDRWMKWAQGRSGSVTSATGAIYAIRRTLYEPVPLFLGDDFMISTGVVAAGKRLVFAPRAIAVEPVAVEGRAEYYRKIRVMNQGLAAVVFRRKLLLPWRHGFYAWQLFSHKLFRRLAAIPLLVLLATSLALCSRGDVFALALCVQAAVYLPAVVAWVLRPWKRINSKLFSVPYYFCMVNLAALVALLLLVCGRRIDRWRTDRRPGAATPLTTSPA